MNVESGDKCGRFDGPRISWHVDVFRFCEITSDCMEQECARAAGRIENSLFVRGGYGVPNDLRGQPVRRIVLSKPIPLVTIDQRLVQNLENVRFNIAQLKPSHMRDDTAYKVDALGIRDDPVEEVTLDRAEDSGRLEPSPDRMRAGSSSFISRTARAIALATTTRNVC